jgi:hypothetical protein
MDGSSFTDADLAAIRSALARGERVVQYADRSVTYRSADELIALEARISQALSSTSSQSRPKQSFGVASKGFC